MLSLRGGRDYVPRSPVHLAHPPPPPTTTTTTTRRGPACLSTGGSNARSAAVRCRVVDSDDILPSGVDRCPGTAPTVLRHWSTSSLSSAAAAAEGRETTAGSILKTSELHRLGGGGAKVAAVSRRPRRVRFTDDVSPLRRFDGSGGDDVDSAYSSTEYDPRQLYAPGPARRSGPPAGGRHVKTSVPGSRSRWNNNGDDDNNKCGTIQSYSVARQQIGNDRQQFPVYPLGIRQPKDVRVGRNGNLEKTHSTPSLHWPSWTSPSSPPPSSSLHRQEPSVVGLSPSCTLATVNHVVVVVVADPVTRKRKSLIVAAKLCGPFLPSDVTVKANKTGSRIRITSAAATSHLHQRQHRGATSRSLPDLNEQILLPVRVDPYGLTARLEPTGDLVIEAPCAL